MMLASIATWVRLRWPAAEQIEAVRVVEADASVVARLLRDIDGMAFCQTPLLCHLAGKEFEYDPFLVTQRLATGRLSETAVLPLFEERQFSAIQLDEVLPLHDANLPLERSEVVLVGTHFTRNVLGAIARNYILVRTSAVGAIYVPRE
jgi:hypothetical protein